jgi:hypothetical protein
MHASHMFPWSTRVISRRETGVGDHLVHRVHIVHSQPMNDTDGQSAARGWTADDSTFGARLALVRQYKKWGNVREAAIACGVPPESWRTWERDHVLPRKYAEVCQRISDATGADRDWLLRGSQASQSPPQMAPSQRQPSAHECQPNPTRPRPKPRPKAAHATRHDALVA